MRSLFFIFLFIPVLTFSQNERKSNGDKNENVSFTTVIPTTPFTVLLGRPTDNSITISVCANISTGILITIKNESDRTKTKAIKSTVAANEPKHILIDELNEGTLYTYAITFSSLNKEQVNGQFKTAIASGTPFHFAVQADSHLDQNTDTAVYVQTLRNIKRVAPDFLIDLGDTWMIDKFPEGYRSAYTQYPVQRYFFDKIGRNTPVFYALGNHDGEYIKGGKNGGSTDMMDWATSMRNRFFPNPSPNNFYSGNNEKGPWQSPIENYYSWEWGDALFIVLDPFRYTRNNRDPWQRTIGTNQYRWLESVLKKSKARFRFVFIHNLSGGVDAKGIARGGAEASQYFEWGGANNDGSRGFESKRSDWSLPIHDLLKMYKVDIVFHGHDHFYAHQEQDGIIYQLVPQPGTARYGNLHPAEEYGYKAGTLLNAPGFLQVSIENNEAQVQFIQTSIDKRRVDQQIVDKYSIKSKAE